MLCENIFTAEPPDVEYINEKNMKKFNLIMILLLFTVITNSNAQDAKNTENYGKTFNIGLGIGGYSGYYGYVGHTLPVFNINYELNAAKNFTLAPFASFYTHTKKYCIKKVFT